MMLTVAHELQSGAALRPEFGAMYGSKNTSEAKQAMARAQRIPAGSIVLADCGYGIFSVVQGMLGNRHDVLFRLTASRFKSLQRKAKLIHQTKESSRYRDVVIVSGAHTAIRNSNATVSLQLRSPTHRRVTQRGRPSTQFWHAILAID
jgi:hypothetical protein